MGARELEQSEGWNWPCFHVRRWNEEGVEADGGAEDTFGCDRRHSLLSRVVCSRVSKPEFKSLRHLSPAY